MRRFDSRVQTRRIPRKLTVPLHELAHMLARPHGRRGVLSVNTVNPCSTFEVSMIDPRVPSFVAFLAGGQRNINVLHAFVQTTSQHHSQSDRLKSSRSSPTIGLPRSRNASAGRLCMNDFSSAGYWNQVYSSGKDGSGQDAVTEWHVEGEVLATAVEDLLGAPSATGHDAPILNVGCGTSSLWERCVG